MTSRLIGSIPPTAQVLVGIVSVQVGAALAKQLFAAAGATGIVALRLVFAALILLAIWRPSLRVTRRTAGVVAAYGSVLAAMNILFYLALERIPLGIAVTVEFLGPMMLALAGSRRWLDALWAVLAGAGVLLLARGGDAELSLLGLFFAFAAGVCWAGYILLGAALGKQSADGSGLALAMGVAGVIALPVGVVGAGPDLMSPGVLVVGLGVALLSSVIPYTLELEALRKIPPRVFGILMSLEPAVAAVAGAVVLGEVLAVEQWVAVCCVVGASVGATRFSRAV
ncbi:EamA family transporter [Actinokineospora sp. G85]|uniref:EamA family transporter n=1 Tax=Actinokineospora sp. G85 TaxID=3406626 RepID=UPI003C71C31E